ncbi:MAG: NRDE family protein [Planctomycetota bacterium]
MCLIVCLQRARTDYPVILAANRDEFHARAAAPVSRIGESPRVWAPRDLLAGGTWLGVNEHGLLVAVTNGPTDVIDRRRASRGTLCLEALGRPTAAEAIEWARHEASPDRYNPFRLLCVDAADVFLLIASAGRSEVRALAPGLHVITNKHEPDGWWPPSLDAIAHQAHEAPIARVLTMLGEVARCHEEFGDPPFASCKHSATRGTRSSALVALAAKHPEESFWWETERAPCEQPYVDRSALFRDARSASPGSRG